MVEHTLHNLEFDCPDCGGVLLPIIEGGFVLFQCEVGHRYAPETLLSAQREKTEYAIWESIRGVAETARLLRKIESLNGQPEPNMSAADLVWHLQQQEKLDILLRQAISELNRERPV
jgi:two-component system chemotaxis response regulator CheB